MHWSILFKDNFIFYRWYWSVSFPWSGSPSATHIGSTLAPTLPLIHVICKLGNTWVFHVGTANGKCTRMEKSTYGAIHMLFDHITNAVERWSWLTSSSAWILPTEGFCYEESSLKLCAPCLFTGTKKYPLSRIGHCFKESSLYFFFLNGKSLWTGFFNQIVSNHGFTDVNYTPQAIIFICKKNKWQFQLVLNKQLFSHTEIPNWNPVIVVTILTPMYFDGL